MYCWGGGLERILTTIQSPTCTVGLLIPPIERVLKHNILCISCLTIIHSNVTNLCWRGRKRVIVSKISILHTSYWDQWIRHLLAISKNAGLRHFHIGFTFQTQMVCVLLLYSLCECVNSGAVWILINQDQWNHLCGSSTDEPHLYIKALNALHTYMILNVSCNIMLSRY